MAAAPVDLDHLARYTGGDKTLNAEILKLFDGQVSEMVGQLLSILEQRDARKWREVTHTIKGAARGVGAFAMGEGARRVASALLPWMVRLPPPNRWTPPSATTAPSK
jgi:HPt (histidine-containing phosphotransfer) domain-containing protein